MFEFASTGKNLISELILGNYATFLKTTTKAIHCKTNKKTCTCIFVIIQQSFEYLNSVFSKYSLWVIRKVLNEPVFARTIVRTIVSSKKLCGQMHELLELTAYIFKQKRNFHFLWSLSFDPVKISEQK